MSDVQQIYAILLSRGYQDELFGGLGNLHRRGQETEASCPFCEDTKRHLSFSSEAPLWHCFKCDRGGDWLAYLQEREGLDFIEALRRLADAAGVELVESSSAKARHQAYTKKAGVLEDAMRSFRETLQAEAGASVMAYLRSRGYTDTDIQSMEIGAYTDRDGLQELLRDRGYSDQEIRESGLLTSGLGDSHQLSILWRDTAGRGVGLTCRTLLPDVEPKYKNSHGLTKDAGLLGFSSVRGSERLLLVEGVLSALLLNARGFKAVALGGKSVSLDQIKALEATGTKELLLALDGDQAGQQATEKVLNRLRTSSLRRYVVSMPAGVKAPDDLVLQRGEEALHDCIKEAERWPEWLARMLVRQHTRSQQDGQTPMSLDAGVDAALECYASLEDPMDRRIFWTELQDVSGFSEADLARRQRLFEEKASSRRASESLRATLRILSQQAGEGDLTGAEETLRDGLRGLQDSRGVDLPAPYVLSQLLEDLSRSSEGLRTGYKSLDDRLCLPRGLLTVLAGRPGHCKTTLQLNLLVGLLEAYPEQTFCFFSYEEASKRLATKLIMLMSGEVLDQRQNRAAFYRYLTTERQTAPIDRIEDAVELFEKYTSSGRLILDDGSRPAEDLAATISLLAKRRPIGAVFCDYIQKVGLRRPQTQRYLDIKRASELLLDTAKASDVAIILGAQLGRGEKAERTSVLRLDNLRESGDLEQDAALVLGLWLQAKADEEAGKQMTGTMDLEIRCLKNRDGESGWSSKLDFDGACQTISEKISNW